MRSGLSGMYVGELAAIYLQFCAPCLSFLMAGYLKQGHTPEGSEMADT